MSDIKEWIAKYQMGLYCKAHGWKVDNWDDLPDEVHQKYYNEADEIISYLKSQVEEQSSDLPTMRVDQWAKGYCKGYADSREEILSKLQ